MQQAVMCCAMVVCVCVCACPDACAQMPTPQSVRPPVNKTCPISGKPVDPGVQGVMVEGEKVGFCCRMCDGQFMAWSDEKKTEYVRTTLGQPSHEEGERVGDPYSLSKCPISGDKLGGAGEPVIEVIDGREIRFCCPDCVAPFMAAQAQHTRELNRRMIADQIPFYPLDTCVVSGETLERDGRDAAVSIIYGNRLVRLCANGCEEEFEKNPDEYLARLDAAVIDAQSEEYPLATCVVSGKELGSMGDPVEIVVANRLVRFCCAMCEPRFESDPAKYLGMIDAAWREHGMPWQKKDEGDGSSTQPRTVGG